MLYITGDVHIPCDDVTRLSSRRFPEGKGLTKSDFLLILGDFGGVWSAVGEEESRENQYWLDWLSKKGFTTLFIDGNHENFDKLKTYPEVDFLGGRAHKIRDGIYHLMRGFVFDIDGKRIFAMGGAESHDKERRREGISFWVEELPTEAEYLRARESIRSCGGRVDIVATHCAPTSIQDMINENYAKNRLCDFFEELSRTLDFKKWYFGHYHTDLSLSEKFTAVYEKIHRA